MTLLGLTSTSSQRGISLSPPFTLGLLKEDTVPSSPLTTGAMETLLMGDLPQKKGDCVGFDGGGGGTDREIKWPISREDFKMMKYYW